MRVLGQKKLQGAPNAPQECLGLSDFLHLYLLSKDEKITYYLKIKST